MGIQGRERVREGRRQGVFRNGLLGNLFVFVFLKAAPDEIL